MPGSLWWRGTQQVDGRTIEVIRPRMDRRKKRMKGFKKEAGKEGSG